MSVLTHASDDVLREADRWRFSALFEDMGKRAPEEEHGWVYLFGREGSPDVKIGFTEQHVSRRLCQAQTSCPDKLVCLAMIVGNVEMEAFFHETFAPIRIQGEWYRDEKGLVRSWFALRETEGAVLFLAQGLRKEALI